MSSTNFSSSSAFATSIPVLSSTGLIAPSDDSSSGSNAAAGTAIAVILAIAFAAIAGYIVYKKFITKKTVIVSGVNMTDTPRMSRRGSYKGVVGGSKSEVRAAGVDAEEEEEVLGEVEDDGDDDTGLSRRDDEDDDDEDEEEEEEEENLTANRQQRMPRRPV